MGNVICNHVFLGAYLDEIPRGEFMRKEQSTWAKSLPVLDFLHACVIQLKADLLSVIFKTTGCGSIVGDVVDTMWRVAQ